MNKISEFDMAKSFAETLKEKRISRQQNYDYIFQEVVCQQGIADFVCINTNGLFEKYKFGKVSSMENCSQILSLLKLNTGRTYSFIEQQTGLPTSTLHRTIKEIINYGYVREDSNLLYRCIPDISSKTTTWAFELKLSNWKRALFQALQYKAFANYSVVVFPYDKQNVLKKNLHFFKNLNVGILLFDALEKQSKWLFYPRKETPISRWHSFFLLGRIISQPSEENIIE